VTLRLAAGLALILGVGALLAFLHMIGKAPWSSLAARHLRAMKDRGAAPDSVAPTTYAALQALPRGLSVAEYSALERRAVSLEGYVQLMLRAPDNDIHLEITPGPIEPRSRHPYVRGEITPQWRRGSSNWSYPELITLFRPNFGGTTDWPAGPRRVRISGWLLNDYESELPAGWVELNPTRRTLTHWELHPVTRIEAWDDSLQEFVDYPR
jgi:hypothetical protein